MLAELYPTMDAAGLQQRLARVIFTAKVWGCCMSDVNLAHAMSLPPQDAIAYFQRKGFAIIGTGKSYGKRPRRRHLPLPKSRAWTSCRTSATPWRKSWPKVRRQHGSGSSSRQCFRPRAGGTQRARRRAHWRDESGSTRQPMAAANDFRANVQTAYMPGDSSAS